MAGLLARLALPSPLYTSMCPPVNETTRRPQGVVGIKLRRTQKMLRKGWWPGQESLPCLFEELALWGFPPRAQVLSSMRSWGRSRVLATRRAWDAKSLALLLWMAE